MWRLRGNHFERGTHKPLCHGFWRLDLRKWIHVIQGETNADKSYIKILTIQKRLRKMTVWFSTLQWVDRLCGLVVRVPGYRSRGSGVDSRRYQIFWEVVDLERGPLSLVRIIEELHETKVATPIQKTEINGRGDSLCWLRDTLYPPMTIVKMIRNCITE
jgi:hypothetical protein